MDKKVDKQATTVRLEHLTYKGQPCIALRFPYETGLIVAAKSAGARWSATNKCWYTPNTPEQLRTCASSWGQSQAANFPIAQPQGQQLPFNLIHTTTMHAVLPFP